MGGQSTLYPAQAGYPMPSTSATRHDFNDARGATSMLTRVAVKPGHDDRRMGLHGPH